MKASVSAIGLRKEVQTIIDCNAKEFKVQTILCISWDDGFVFKVWSKLFTSEGAAVANVSLCSDYYRAVFYFQCLSYSDVQSADRQTDKALWLWAPIQMLPLTSPHDLD